MNFGVSFIFFEVLRIRILKIQGRIINYKIRFYILIFFLFELFYDFDNESYFGIYLFILSFFLKEYSASSAQSKLERQ